MRRFISNLKKNNEGMSLVEILATLAIICIVATPLINAFINAMRTDAQARLIQNGTSVGQDVAEMFKIFDVEIMAADYGVEADENGVYTFKDIEMEGANGEDFLVDVTLDPRIYSGDEETDKLQVNDVRLPVFSGLHHSDSVVIQRQYTTYDDQLAELFAPCLSAEVTNNIYTNTEKSKIKKATAIQIKCTYDDERDEYMYDIKLVMTYTYDGTKIVTGTSVMPTEWFGADEVHSIYMICPVFDKINTIVTGTDYYYGTDKINVMYEYTGTPGKQKDLYFYIAEQEVKNQYDTSKQQRINPANLSVDNVAYTDYDVEDEHLKLYTNIGNTDEFYKNKYNLTYGDDYTGTALYEMTVVVKDADTGDTVRRFTTTR